MQNHGIGVKKQHTANQYGHSSQMRFCLEPQSKTKAPRYSSFLANASDFLDPQN